MPLLFAATLFVSAFLLFLVQPMVGKLLLPLLGGTPAVWNTCMVFFQAVLLAGYSYAHATTDRLGVRTQARWHLLLLALPLAVLALTAAFSDTNAPIAVFRDLAPQGQDYPFFGLVVLLAVTIGLPFFVVSTSAPLLQSWFASTGHHSARDPYFLYAASNLGSMLALIAYPVLLEPSLRLSQQAWAWAAGYVVLVGLTAACSAVVRNAPSPAPPREEGPKTKSGARLGPGPVPFLPEPPLPPAASRTVDPAGAPLTWMRRLRWLVLAAVPSSLMLGVTTYATTDLAPIPMLWVVPLALYLATFIVAFSRTPSWLQMLSELAAPPLLLLLVFMLVSSTKPSLYWLTIGMHLLAFLAAALVCHVQLAKSRPPANRLTEFYLWVSLGGVLGGLFNALVAPLAFNSLMEYPLVLIIACFLQPARDADGPADEGMTRVLDFAIPVVIGVLTAFLCSLYYDPDEPLKFPRLVEWLSRHLLPVSDESVQKVIVYGVPALLCYYFVERPLRFGLGVALFWLAATAMAYKADTFTLLRERSFFGTLHVEREAYAAEIGGHKGRLQFHRLVHGTILHGKQCFDPLSDEPLTYYHRTGPIGQVFAQLPRLGKQELAFIGLGTGTLSAYGQPGQRLTFYEIDTAVKRIAENPNYFTYVTDARAKGVTCDIVLGDARLKMAEVAKPGQYGLIVVDAFSSDAIPVHLLTLQAVQMYADKLTPDGMIALHVSNRYLNLVPVAARIAREAGLAALTQFDDPDETVGKLGSRWVILARRVSDFGTLPEMTEEVEKDGQKFNRLRWQEPELPPNAPLWTDDFSNILSVFNWK